MDSLPEPNNKPFTLINLSSTDNSHFKSRCNDIFANLSNSTLKKNILKEDLSDDEDSNKNIKVIQNDINIKSILKIKTKSNYQPISANKNISIIEITDQIDIVNENVNTIQNINYNDNPINDNLVTIQENEFNQDSIDNETIYHSSDSSMDNLNKTPSLTKWVKYDLSDTPLSTDADNNSSALSFIESLKHKTDDENMDDSIDLAHQTHKFSKLTTVKKISLSKQPKRKILYLEDDIEDAENKSEDLPRKVSSKSIKLNHLNIYPDE
ncbi:unnamed protein product [Gordionus sp. m RMFG-2023]|uniref:probable serine/threonine-protein kinase tsuA isoform X1 n=1 Tax=Gordionus sp. m RMFG-2023 TaxID=3053472 RepID=UPI0030E10098